MRGLLLLPLLLAACAPPPVSEPTPAPAPAVNNQPVTVCPGDPPPGYVCAPPLVCRDASEWLALDRAWYVRVFTTQALRDAAAHYIQGTEDLLCGETATPAGTALRRKL